MRQCGELEAVIMHRLWSWAVRRWSGEMVGDLQKDRQIAYTTVMTVMVNLYRKGWLRRHLLRAPAAGLALVPERRPDTAPV
jgi:predicted transcriptional regulator